MDKSRLASQTGRQPVISLGQLVVDIGLGFGIGLSLGLLGGGGSLLTVPALVYILGQTPQSAISTSLAIVGANSMVGAAFHHRQGTLNWRVALLFGGSGIGVAYLSAGLSSGFPAEALMVAFGLLMLVVGTLMLLQKRPADVNKTSENRNGLIVIVSGAAIGFLTGLLGVGGGFLIVPALVMLVGLPMSQAVGTSLVIIAANSIAGLAGHLNGSGLDIWLAVIFIAAGLAGSLWGARLSRRLPETRMRQAFALFVVILAMVVLVDFVPKLFI
jgi:uncharacterized protein